MRIHLIGGFLGAGKTTLVRTLARRLREAGERVIVITNDQGSSLVDTALCRPGGEVAEITGGCFCCRYDELERALFAAADAGATVAIAEAVGSCTDLIATVLAPLADRHPGKFALAPLAVVVDPWRLQEVASGGVHADVAYLFQKQIEEADIALVSRADLAPPDVTAAIRAICPDAAIVLVSGRTGAGIDRWLAAKPARPAAPLTIDYDRYAAAEALLGWSNAEVVLCADQPFDPATVMDRFLCALADAPIAHIKLAMLDSPGTPGQPCPGAGRSTGLGTQKSGLLQGPAAALVRRGAPPAIERGDLPGEVTHARLLVNARIALPPPELETLLRAAMDRAAAPARVEWIAFECFSPARPVPTHRYVIRSGTDDDASCCAAFYGRPEVRYLLGESLHPGGVELTLRVAESLKLKGGSRLLDVACGNGSSLRAILARWPIAASGIDAQATPFRDDRLQLLQGDAHFIPWDEASFDAILCECALSTFFDQPGALREMRRVLRPGGRVAVTDMVVDGLIPDSLRDWVHAGTCLAKAMSADRYVQSIEAAGLRVVERFDATFALRELLSRIKRNLVGAALAAATGNLPIEVKLDVKAARAVLREADAAVQSGAIRYGAFIAERAP